MARPCGDVRQALVEALRTRGPMPLRTWAAEARVGYRVADSAVRRMVGVQVQATSERVRLPGACKPSRVFALIEDRAPAVAPADPFAALSSWVAADRHTLN